MFLVGKWGILRRPMISTHAHNIMVALLCTKLRNLGVNISVTRVKPHAKEFKDHDRLFVVSYSNFVDNEPRDLKAKVKISLRDCRCDIVKDGEGGVMPVVKLGKRARLS